MLRSLDVFSGIGGFTWGLRDVCTTAAYCEIEPSAVDVLRARMRSGHIPTAPICDDVDRLTTEWIRDQTNVPIDIILAGFPCQGFSLMGHQHGYKHDGTSLYRHIVRLVSDLRPPLVLLENVPMILCKGMHHIVQTLCVENGYELRWIILGASDLGAPHMRRRWFCLAIRNDAKARSLLEERGQGPDPFQWNASTSPAVMTLSQSHQRRTRCAALGNSVVPDCVRRAFFVLSNVSIDEVPHCGHGKHHPVWPNHGRCVPDEPPRVFRWTRSKDWTEKRSQVQLTFDPGLYTAEKPRSKLQTAPLVSQPVSSKWWMTPRHGNVTAANVLTQRTLRDLPSQVRFERGTPDELRKGQLSPDFVEWMMGFPAGWTDIDEGCI